MSTVGVSGRRPSEVAGTFAVWVWGLLSAAAGVLLVIDGLRNPVVSSDTVSLVQTVDTTLAHLRSGQLLHWGGGYALLQAIPTIVLRTAGASTTATINALVGLNVASVLAMSWIAWSALHRRSRTGAFLLVAILLSGALLWYLHASVGEPLAAVVTLAAVVATWNTERSLRPAALLFLAGLSKDTAVPFLLLLTFAASVGSPQWAEPSFRRRRVAALLIGAGASLLVTAAYNYARFGSVFDLPYLSPILYVPWLGTQLNFFAAIWLAPNGGLLLYWPSFGVLLLLAAVAMVRAVRGSRDWGSRLARLAPAVGVGGTLLGMTVALSRWVSPLGWSAWGPRLILPWIPACAFLLVAAYAEELELLIARLTRPALPFLVAGAALAAASLPQYVAIVDPQLWRLVFVPDATCHLVPVIENGAAYYYRCTEHQMWSKASMLVAAYMPGSDLTPLLLGCACAGGLLWLLYRVRAASVASVSLPFAGRVGEEVLQAEANRATIPRQYQRK